MIQRIQSLFFLLAALGFGALFMFPFATSDIPIPHFFSDQEYNIFDSGIIAGIVGLGAFAAIAAIFLFKNRSLQLKIGYLVITLAILVPVVAFLLLYTEQTALASEDLIHDKAGMYLPIVSVLFGFLANRSVKKDDKLVKSMDRLR